MFQLGDIAVDGTAFCYFPTFDSVGASITITGLAVTDIECFKDGVATTRASDNGYALLDTDGIDFNGMVGIHGFKIDLSDNSDAGFYAAGSHYMVAVDAITVDSQTARFLYVFTIGQLLRPTTAGRTADIQSTGEMDANLTMIGGVTQSATDLKDFADDGYDPATNKVQGVVLVDTLTTYTGNTLQTGDSFAVVNSGTFGNAQLDIKLDRNADLGESRRGFHTWQGNVFYVDPVNGNDANAGTRAAPRATIQSVHDDLVTDSNHDVIILLAGAAAGVTTHTVAATTTLSKRYLYIRGPGRDFIITRTGAGDTITITADGMEISGVQIGTAATGAGDGINATDADFHRIHDCWFLDTQGDGIHGNRVEHTRIHDNHFLGTGVGGSGQGVHISGTGGAASNNAIFDNEFADTAGTAILVENGTILNTQIFRNTIHGATGWGIDIGGASTDAMVYENVLGGNSSGNIQDGGTTSVLRNNEQWAKAGAIRDDLDDDFTAVQKSSINVEVDNALDTAIPGSPTANSINERMTFVDDRVAYMDAHVHIDTVGGTAGTTKGTHGTRSTPSSNLADSVTLAAALGIQEYHLLGMSSILLISAHSNWTFLGQNGATVNIGGVNVSGSHFECLTLTGDMDGNDTTQRFCKFQSLTNFIADATFCLLIDNVTESLGDHYWFQCASGVAGTGTPHIDVAGDGINARNNHLRGWLGGLEIRTHTSTDLTSFDCPAGQIVVAASGTGGTIAMRGLMDVTDNASGAVTFAQNPAVNMTKINAEVDTGLADINLDHLMKTAVANNADMTVEVADGTALSNIISATSDTSTFVVSTDSLEGNTNRLGEPNGPSVSADILKILSDLPVRPTRNVAIANFMFFMALSSDHVTGATGLTVTAERSIDGGGFAACANSVVEIANGAYKINLTPADRNGDEVLYKFTATTADATLILMLSQPT